MKNSLFSQKGGYLRNNHRNAQKVVVFLTNLNGANQVENLDLFNQLFSIKPVKGDKY